MNAPKNFRNLSELADAIRESVALLNGGQLSLQDLEALTEDSRELFERVVVLRYKAYDDSLKGSTKESVQESEEFQTPFRIEVPPATNQVTLLDVIEEIESTEPVSEQPIAFNEPVPSASMEHKHEVIPSGDLNHVLGQMRTESLNDRLSKSAATGSLAQKLEHSPIPDLKKAITLNQRFQFSRELFKGNNQEYEVAIEKLNANNRDEALRHLDALKSKYSWNNDAQVTQDFVELIERRHLG